LATTSKRARVPRNASALSVPSDRKTRAVRPITKTLVRSSIRAPSSNSSGAMNRAVPDTFLVRSAAIIVCKGSERGLRLPSHVWIRIAQAAFENLDHSVTGHVQVLARVTAVRQIVNREGVHERGVDALGLEDLQQLAQIRGLLILVARVLPVQAGGAPVVDPHHDPSAVACHVGPAPVRAAPDLGARDGLPLRAALRDEGADVLAEALGRRRRAIGGVGGDDVEWGPVDALQRERRVADLPAEPLTDYLDGFAEEVFDTGANLRYQLAQTMWRGER